MAERDLSEVGVRPEMVTDGTEPVAARDSEVLADVLVDRLV